MGEKITKTNNENHNRSNDFDIYENSYFTPMLQGINQIYSPLKFEVISLFPQASAPNKNFKFTNN